MALGNKEIMAENIKYFMDRKGVDRNQLCADLDLKYMTVSDWINAKSYPRIDKIELLANYFGVSKSDLVEPRNSPTKEPTPTIDLSNLRERVVLFDGKPLSDEDVEKITKIIELSLEVSASEDR
ncbi:helix-turn-helix domain-containing protein [Streptococcus suis]|uniref:helix-turn-helix domain-containing protein n=1 Tax=Streptococcus suis TaxID=1307 RepID=UPI000F63882D|nr:XRE family transcriptional regulator [Streptococcus suis]RRR45596.1 XRE family transcriptional regulator [Streptococcus suis]RRR60069.1 XRE family transcriptional regulator [Streptococcus suis]